MSDTISTQLGAYAGYISLAIAIGGIIVGVVNRKKITSSCCGRIASASLVIEDASPTKLQPPPKEANNTTTDSRPSVAI